MGKLLIIIGIYVVAILGWNFVFGWLIMTGLGIFGVDITIIQGVILSLLSHFVFGISNRSKI